MHSCVIQYSESVMSELNLIGSGVQLSNSIFALSYRLQVIDARIVTNCIFIWPTDFFSISIFFSIKIAATLIFAHFLRFRTYCFPPRVRLSIVCFTGFKAKRLELQSSNFHSTLWIQSHVNFHKIFFLYLMLPYLIERGIFV